MGILVTNGHRTRASLTRSSSQPRLDCTADCVVYPVASAKERTICRSAFSSVGID